MCPSLLFTVVILFVTTLLLSSWHFAEAIDASPIPFSEIQEDGVDTGKIYVRGSPEVFWYEDANGYTVCLDPKFLLLKNRKEKHRKWFYCKQGADGDLEIIPGAQVGKRDPSKIPGLQKGEQISEQKKKEKCGEYCLDQEEASSKTNVFNLPGNRYGHNNPKKLENQAKSENNGSNKNKKQQTERKLVVTTGTAKHLVVPIVFSDHVNRTNRPTVQELEMFMNNEVPDATLCPTGCIKQVWLESSNYQFNVETTVYHEWITLNHTEAFCTNGTGKSTNYHVALAEALMFMDAAGFNFSEFDLDKNGKVDMLTFLHSGFASEFGGQDEYGASTGYRMWSHAWLVTFNATSLGGRVKKQKYATASALWGTTGNEIGRIGVVAHEMGHLLDLPDLYDKAKPGGGLGMWSFMSQAWGFTFDQLYPSMLDPWCKLWMGWANIIPLDSYQRGVSLGPSYTTNDYYKIHMGFPSLEFLLIENRQRIGFDAHIPQEGLLIYHIDEWRGGNQKLHSGHNLEGYPGIPGWPENNLHYRVAILGADGNYDLEKSGQIHGVNYGDAGDIWHGSSLSLGPGTCGLLCDNRMYPNTDSYQYGIVNETGNLITSISDAQEIMTFDYISMDDAIEIQSSHPSSSPSDFPSAMPSQTPSWNPSNTPSATPSESPSSVPTYIHSDTPSVVPSSQPSKSPSMVPSQFPSATPSHAPSATPSESPSSIPTYVHSDSPSAVPSFQPSTSPSTVPSQSPSVTPSHAPSAFPSSAPSGMPSESPSVARSDQPSLSPSNLPSLSPSISPSNWPSQEPSLDPTASPSAQPSSVPSNTPSSFPSDKPSAVPSTAPSETPSRSPSFRPSAFPTPAPSPLPTTPVPLTTTGEPTVNPNSALCSQQTKRRHCKRAEVCTWKRRFKTCIAQ